MELRRSHAVLGGNDELSIGCEDRCIDNISIALSMLYNLRKLKHSI
jgi:hypothetical protein